MGKRRGTSKPVKTSPLKPEPKDNFLSRYWAVILALAGLYILIAVFFAPVVVKQMVMGHTPDMFAAAGMNKTGEEMIKEGEFPLWNPTLFCGMPMFGSLQYALFIYPPEYLIRVLSYIFGFGDYRIWLFHYLMAGIFAFLLARHYGLGRIASWLTGAAYAFSPQLIVLVEVGHGSKLMGFVYLPLLWLLMDRLRIKPSLGRAAALGAVFAVEILALHPQVAAYAGIMMGLFLLYYGINALRVKDIGKWIRFAVAWCISLVISLALSAILWVSVLDFARFSIRGSGAEGAAGAGVGWEYATGWSFHPLESITYLFPKFMGYVGQTYWGTVGTFTGQPMTQNPMYFGIITVILAIMAFVILKKNRWGFPLTLGTFAWVLSFGKYLPILYAPFFYMLPFFNKFRAPVMGQVLLLLPVALLAGMGLQAIVDASQRKEKPDRFIKGCWIAAGTALGLALLFYISKDFFNSLYYAFAGLVSPNADPQRLASAFEPARLSSAVTLLFGGIGLAAIAAARKRLISWQWMGIVLIGFFATDLWLINKPLVSFNDPTSLKGVFKPENVINYLNRQPGKFRVHPLDDNYPALYWYRKGIKTNANPSNWLGYFGKETTRGYFGAKSADYQAFMSATGLDLTQPGRGMGLTLFTNPQLFDALNVRYIMTVYDIPRIFAEWERQTGMKPVRPANRYRLEFEVNVDLQISLYLYRNLEELPRVRLVDNYRVIEDLDLTLQEIAQGAWDPHQETLIDQQPAIQPQPGGDGSAEIVSYAPHEVQIKVNSSAPKLLVLADAYYPSGWTAMIDGKETAIIRADGVLRAIAVPQGEHDVVFRFHPKWFYVGFYISLSALILLLCGLIIWLVKRKRRSRLS